MQTLTVPFKSDPSYIPWEVSTPDEYMGPSKLGGIGASPGIVEGPCTVITNPEELPALHEGTILVCEIPSPELTQYMQFVRGMVTGRGGILCIASVYAREINIPAVVCVGDFTDTIHTGDIIRIDGSMGIVEITSRFSG
jgi:pyruvate,water dikinase